VIGKVVLVFTNSGGSLAFTCEVFVTLCDVARDALVPEPPPVERI